MRRSFDQRALYLVSGVAALALAIVVAIPASDGPPEKAARYIHEPADPPALGPTVPYQKKETPSKPAEKTVINAPSTEQVKEAFKRHDYSLAPIRQNNERVPKLLLTAMPHDLADVVDIPLKKKIFFKTVLPLVLQTNEKIMAERKRVWVLHYRKTLGENLGAVDRSWLNAIAKKYNVKDGNTAELLNRIDVIPPSLALAQAAEESGWGTSRFVRHGNAMFGQWTFKAGQKGITPKGRDAGKSHRIRAFDTLLESVEAYARNLNTHRAYKALRAKRASMRNRGQVIDGSALAKTLNKYSERGEAYVDGLLSIINANNLAPLDKARLQKGSPIRETIIQADNKPITKDVNS